MEVVLGGACAASGQRAHTQAEGERVEGVDDESTARRAGGHTPSLRLHRHTHWTGTLTRTGAHTTLTLSSLLHSAPLPHQSKG